MLEPPQSLPNNQTLTRKGSDDVSNNQSNCSCGDCQPEQFREDSELDPTWLERIAELERENAELRAIVECVDECRRVGVLKVLCVDPGSERACAAAQKKLNQLLAAAA